MQKICIYGIGGVGGYFGGKIAYEIQQQQKETQVYFIARGPHLAAIQQQGLVLNSSEQQGMRCYPTLATERIQEIPTPDLCIVSVKGYDLDIAAQALAAHIKKSTIILPLLNGVDIYDRLRRHISTGIILPSCVYIRAYIEQPGVVAETGSGGQIICGDDPGVPEFDPHPLLTFFEQMHIRCTWQADPSAAIWGKYMFIASYGLVTTYSDKTLGEVMDDQELAATTRSIIREIWSIANQSGVSFSEEVIESAFQKAKVFPSDTTTSYQRDVTTKGKKNEGDLFGGTILRLGEKFGVATPATEAIYRAIEERLCQN